MSVQGAPIARPGNQFFDQLPDDAVRSVFEFLKGEDGALALGGDDRAVIATAAVCRNWRDNVALGEEREESSTRLHQRIGLQNIHRQMGEREYPLQMRQLFQNCNFPIWRLPVLDLGDRMGETDYIDFIQSEEMNQFVMKFRDSYGRPGVALKIQASPAIVRQHELARIYQGMKRAFQARDLSRGINLLRRTGNLLRNWGANEEIVLALFKRYINVDSRQWSYGWGNSDNAIEDLYKYRHDRNDHVGSVIMACPTCPFVGTKPSDAVLQTLLTNQDPDFKLPGHNGDQAVIRSRGISQRTIVVTALAALAIAYLVNYYLTSSERSSL